MHRKSSILNATHGCLSHLFFDRRTTDGQQPLVRRGPAHVGHLDALLVVLNVLVVGVGLLATLQTNKTHRGSAPHRLGLQDDVGDPATAPFDPCVHVSGVDVRTMNPTRVATTPLVQRKSASAPQ